MNSWHLHEIGRESLTIKWLKISIHQIPTNHSEHIFSGLVTCNFLSMIKMNPLFHPYIMQDRKISVGRKVEKRERGISAN